MCGANKADTHLIGVEPGRDFSFEEMDVRAVEAGDLAPGGHPIEIEPAIEVGQIFKLGRGCHEALPWCDTVTCVVHSAVPTAGLRASLCELDPKTNAYACLPLQ